MRRAQRERCPGRGTRHSWLLPCLRTHLSRNLFPLFRGWAGVGPWRTAEDSRSGPRGGERSPGVPFRQGSVMSVSLCVWHAMGAVLSWFTFHLSGFLLEAVEIFKRCGVSNGSCRRRVDGRGRPEFARFSSDGGFQAWELFFSFVCLFVLDFDFFFFRIRLDST